MAFRSQVGRKAQKDAQYLKHTYCFVKCGASGQFLVSWDPGDSFRVLAYPRFDPDCVYSVLSPRQGRQRWTALQGSVRETLFPFSTQSN